MSVTSPLEMVTSFEDAQEIVRNAARVLPTGAGTKPSLAKAAAGTLSVDMRGLSGIVEYEPAEYTITALAGTPVSELETALRKNGQCLPFDPVFVRAGSTVGGAVASGLSGSGRLRYGGIRDFILGVRFVDGRGRLMRGGGKVVKNAAGFDFPKLLVGSMGRLGVLLDATFKVFPRPAAHATLLTKYATVESALADMQRLSVSPIELIAMDLAPATRAGPYTLATRIGGLSDLLAARVERLRGDLPDSAVLEGDEEAAYWVDAAEFDWAAPATLLVKVPITPSSIPGIESVLAGAPAAANGARRYAVAGNLLWLSWAGPEDALHELLAAHNFSGVVLRGDSMHPLLGATTDSPFAQRVKAALDPEAKFQNIHPV